MRHFFRVGLVLLAVCATVKVFPPPAAAQDGPPEPPQLDPAKYDAQDWSFFLVINGVPVDRRGPHTSSGWEVPPGVQKPGENTLTIVATLTPLIAGAPQDLSFTLMRDASGGRKTLAQLKISPAEAHDEVSRSVKFEGQPKAVWNLDSLQHVEKLTQGDRDEMYGLLKQYVDAQNKQDVDAYLKTIAFRMKATANITLNASNSSMIRGGIQPFLASQGKTELREMKDLKFREFDQGVIVWSEISDEKQQTWVVRTQPKAPQKFINYGKSAVFCRENGKWVMF
jgi:uncharacterized Zn-binding protein involved in type VI secretion